MDIMVLLVVKERLVVWDLDGQEVQKDLGDQLVQEVLEDQKGQKDLRDLKVVKDEEDHVDPTDQDIIGAILIAPINLNIIRKMNDT